MVLKFMKKCETVQNVHQCIHAIFRLVNVYFNNKFFFIIKLIGFKNAINLTI